MGLKPLAKQTVLVTGGCGYIGSHVVRQLSEAGVTPVVVDNLSTGFRTSLLHGEKLYVTDLADEAATEALFAEHKFTAVLHFAAGVRVEESVADPLKYYRNNTLNTLRLIGLVVKHRVPRMVFSSTAAVYGTPAVMPVGEDAPLKPESPYGASKMMSERMLQDVAAATGLKYVILRYFNVAGADPQARIGQRTPQATHLIKVACEVAVGHRPAMSLYGTDYPTPDGTTVRDYIHVEDLASAHLLGMAYLEGGGQSAVLNCGYGQGSSTRAVIAAVKAVSGVDFPVQEEPRRPGDVAAVVASGELLRQRFGWQPKFENLATIVAHAYAWEQKLNAARK